MTVARTQAGKNWRGWQQSLLLLFFTLSLAVPAWGATTAGGAISGSPGPGKVAPGPGEGQEDWRAAMAQPDPDLEGLSDEKVRILGERMYREGLLPSGDVMEAYIRGDIEVDSTAFSCSSCHQRAGLGSFEGGVVTPPTTGSRLYRPYRRPPSLNDITDIKGRYIYAKTIIKRPAYTRDSLKSGLRDGEDPAGELYNDVMPRYPLEKRDMAILVRYLELLSADSSPGAEPTGFKFATIITDDVSDADRKALLEPLQRFIDEQNQQVVMYRKFLQFGFKPTSDMKYSFRGASLAVWDLHGPPDSWGAQLAAWYQKDPVFAVLGGISNQDWRPIHEFCEARRLPCLFPITDLPVVSSTDWYTFYFNKGYYLEGETAARFLKRMEGVDADTRVLQLVQDSLAGRALAAGFVAAREDLGEPPVETLPLSADLLQNPKALAALVAGKQPAVLLVWADADHLPHLPDLLENHASPAALFVSATALGQATATIPEELREKVFITFPYRLKPYIGDEEGTGFLAKNPVLTTFRDFGDRRIANRTGIMLKQVVLQGLRLLYDNLYRDYLLDVMSMQMDQVVADYERFSYGPGQRYASKGCYIIQLGPGPEPELLPRSGWVIH